jgi:tetratricopeptide (TPR) repeat protein
MKKYLSLWIILLLTIPVFSEAEPFESVMEMFYSYESPDVIENALVEEMDGIGPLENPLNQKVLESYYYFNLGLLDLRREEKRQARSQFQQSYDLANQALEIEGTLEVYRMLASSGFSLAATKGLVAIISMTVELDLYTSKVLKLDPKDALGLLMKGQRLIFAPRFAGGDPELALELLNTNLMRLDELTKPLQFETLAALSYCWEKLDDHGKALVYAQWAQQLYPENQDGLNRLEDLNR